jgi:hypothetical protein
MTTVTIQHALELGYCAWGVRAWFRGREVTFETFLKEGVSSEWLKAQNDHQGTELAEHAERQWAARIKQ